MCVFVCVDKCYLNNLSGCCLTKGHMSICINGLHTDVRMFCSLSFLLSLLLCIIVTIIFVQLVLLVCKHFLSCTKQKKNAVFIHSNYFITYFKTINSCKNSQACLCFCFVGAILP